MSSMRSDNQTFPVGKIPLEEEIRTCFFSFFFFSLSEYVGFHYLLAGMKKVQKYWYY